MVVNIYTLGAGGVKVGGHYCSEVMSIFSLTTNEQASPE